MSVTANLHRVSSMEAVDLGSSSCIRISSENGDIFTVFMPYEVALATAESFNSTMKLSEGVRKISWKY